MAAAAPAATIPDPVPDEPVRIRPLTVDEYHRMLEAGILYEREPVELVDGQLIAMPPEGPLHTSVVSRLTHELVRRFGDRAIVRPGNPVTLPPVSEPQPDFTLVPVRADWYREAHPGPDDVLLLVEVSYSTLRYDRSTKLAAYARAGITEVWIVNLVHRQVEAFADPVGEGYRSSGVLGRDDALAPRAFPDDVIPVAAFLP